MSYKKYAQRANPEVDVSKLSHTQKLKKQRDIKRRERNRNFVNSEIKKRGCCEFCGLIDDPKVYQWHHIDDDDITRIKISQLIGRATLDRISEELEKCVMLCPTCHQKYHQDLLCMLDHRDQHISGSFYEINPLEKNESIRIVDPVFNPIFQEWEDGKIEFVGDEGKECYLMLEKIAEHRKESVDDSFWNIIRECLKRDGFE